MSVSVLAEEKTMKEWNDLCKNQRMDKVVLRWAVYSRMFMNLGWNEKGKTAVVVLCGSESCQAQNEKSQPRTIMPYYRSHHHTPYK